VVRAAIAAVFLLVVTARAQAPGPVLPGGRFHFSYPNLFAGAGGVGSPEGFVLRYAAAKANPLVIDWWARSGRDIRALNPAGAYFKHINLRSLETTQCHDPKIEGHPDCAYIQQQRPEWLLRDAAGATVPIFLPTEQAIDFGNDAYLDWVLGTWLPSQFDATEKRGYLYWQQDNGWFFAQRINCKAGDAACLRYTTDEGMQSAWVHMLTRLKQRFPKAKIILNTSALPGGYGIAADRQMAAFQRVLGAADGYYSECLTDRHCYWSSESNANKRVALETTMRLAAWLAANNKYFLPHEGLSSGRPVTQADTNYAWAFYNLVRAGDYSAFNKTTTDAAGQWVPANYPEMDLPLGAALEPATQIQPHVYRRRFEHAVAWVNLSDAPVTLPASGRNSLEQPIPSPLTLAPFDGITAYTYDPCSTAKEPMKTAITLLLLTTALGAQTAITTEDAATAAIAVKTAKGNAASCDGVPKWASSDPTVATVTPSADGLSAKVAPLKEGTATISVDVDADMTAGVRLIRGSAQVNVKRTEAATVTITIVPDGGTAPPPPPPPPQPAP
jgi:hypothetical protein